MQRSQSSGRISSTLALGAGDAGVVDQHVQAAEFALHVGEQALHVFGPGHVGEAAADVGLFGGAGFQRAGVDVANVHLRAMLGKSLRDCAADAGGAGRHQHAQSLCGSIHGRQCSR